MTTLTIPAHESGVVRIFAIDLPAAEIPGFVARTVSDDGDTISHPVAEALGADVLDEDFFEIANLKDLEEYGFDTYLTTGLGISAEAVAEHALTIASLKDHVLIVMSAAFDGMAQTLNVRTPLRHVLTFSEDRPAVKFDPLPNQGAQGEIPQGKPPKSDARIGGMVATIVLFLLFALVALMIWIGG